MKNGKSTILYLNQDRVTQYAKLKAQLEEMTQKCRALNQELKDGLEAGRYCPKAGPFVVSLGSDERASVTWKKEWKKLAKDLYGTRWTTVQAKLIARSKVPQLRLLVRANPRYKAEVVEFSQKRRA